MNADLEVTITEDHAEVRGERAQELLEWLTGRPPTYNATAGAWATGPHRARTLIALAERNGLQVEVTDLTGGVTL